MTRIKKYKTFHDARIGLYEDMWKSGFEMERVEDFFNKMKESLEAKNILKKQIYPSGIYFFRTFKDAEKDLKKRIKEANFDNP